MGAAQQCAAPFFFLIGIGPNVGAGEVGNDAYALQIKKSTALALAVYGGEVVFYEKRGYMGAKKLARLLL